MIKLLNKMGLFIEWEYFNRVYEQEVAGSQYFYRYSKVLDKWQIGRLHSSRIFGDRIGFFIRFFNWYNIFPVRKPKMRQIEGVWCVSVIEEIQKGPANTPRYKPIRMKKEQA